MRKSILHLILLIASEHVMAQRYAVYHSLDSIKEAHSASLRQLSSNMSRTRLDSVRNSYKEIEDSVRDMAHDYTDSVIEHMDRYSHIELSTDLSSNQYYYGRRGPATGAEGLPALKYYHKTGLYAMMNADIYGLRYSAIRTTRAGKTDTVSSQKTEPDLTFTAGWDRTFFDKWDINLYYDHTVIFYGTDKNLLSNTLDLNTGFDFWTYITARVEYQFLFGGAAHDPYRKKLSNVLQFDLYKDFKIYRLPNSAILSIGPEILSYVGNDNLARSRVIARNRHGGENIPELYDNFFGLMDIEGAVNVQYRTKNLEISLSPHVALPFNEIPQNLPPTVTQASQLAQYRQNQMQPPVFFMTAGLRYYFKFWKETARHKNKRND